jgi:archaellum biogenesis ATPase FlaH
MTEIKEIQETLDKDFSKYGQKFQLALLSLLIQDRSFANNIRLILSPEYFDNIYCQNICRMILDYMNTYHSVPDFETLKMIIETDNEIVSAKVYLMTLDSIIKANLSNREFIQQEAQKFCFTKFALKKIEEETALILKGDFEKARNVSFVKYKPVNTGVKEYDLKKDYNLVLQEKVNIPVPTNLPSINKISQGGPGAGNLCIVVAQSNFGKSNYLVSLAQGAAKDGKKVVYFSLETDGVQLMQRAIANLSNLQQELLKEHPLLIKEKIDKLKGNIKLIELKSIDAYVDKLKMLIDEMKADNFFPELIIVDGLNQVKAPLHLKFTNSNDKFEYLAEELRDLAKEEQIPIWCAFQQNRCLSLDTKVETPDGTKLLKDLKEGELILTHEGFKKVLKVYPVEKQPVYKIKMKSGEEIICSINHEFPTPDGLKSIKNGLEVGNQLYLKRKD